MAIKRRRITLSDTSAHDLGLGASFGLVYAIDVKSSADTSVSLAVVDDDGKTVATIASSDYTTLARFNIEPAEATVYDTAGEAAAADVATGRPVVAKSPLTLTASGMASGTLTVDVFVEV